MEALNVRAGDRVRLSNGDCVTVLGFMAVRVPRPVHRSVCILRVLDVRVGVLLEPQWLHAVRRWLAGSDTVRMVRVSTVEGRIYYDDPPPTYLIVPPGLIAAAVIDAPAAARSDA